MAASNAVKAIGTMVRIQSKRKNKTKHKTAEKRKNSYLYQLIGSYLSVQI